jgi:hypothetical protein
MAKGWDAGGTLRTEMFRHRHCVTAPQIAGCLEHGSAGTEGLPGELPRPLDDAMEDRGCLLPLCAVRSYGASLGVPFGLDVHEHQQGDDLPHDDMATLGRHGRPLPRIIGDAQWSTDPSLDLVRFVGSRVERLAAVSGHGRPREAHMARTCTGNHWRSRARCRIQRAIESPAPPNVDAAKGSEIGPL